MTYINIRKSKSKFWIRWILISLTIIIIGIVIMVGWLFYSVYTFRKGTRALKIGNIIGLPNMTGTRGTAVSVLNPEGWVKIRGELWSAKSVSGELRPGSKILVTGQSRLKLVVSAADARGAGSDESRQHGQETTFERACGRALNSRLARDALWCEAGWGCPEGHKNGGVIVRAMDLEVEWGCLSGGQGSASRGTEVGDESCLFCSAGSEGASLV